MKEELKNGAEKTIQLGPMETMFKMELDSLEEKDKIAKIMNCFQLWTKDCKKFDIYLFDQTDEALLWIVDLLKETFLARQMPEQDNLWDFNIHIQKAYAVLPDKLKSSFYPFPKAKEKMLRIILDQWDVSRCDEHGQEILNFIWETYGCTNMHSYERPLDERKTIDSLIMKKLEDAEAKHVEKWIKWIHDSEKWSGKDSRNIPGHLGRYFALARARSGGFRGAWWDVRREKIVDALGIRDVGDDILSALCFVCLEQMTLLKDVRNCMEQIVFYLLLKNKTKTICKLGPVNKVEISIKITNITEIPGYADIFTPEENFANILKHILDEFEKLGVSKPDGRVSFRGNKAVNLELSVCDANGEKMSKKEWYA